MSESTMIIDQPAAWEESPDRIVFRGRPDWGVYVQERICEWKRGRWFYENLLWHTACDEDLIGDVIGGDDTPPRFCPQCGGRVEVADGD